MNILKTKAFKTIFAGVVCASLCAAVVGCDDSTSSNSNQNDPEVESSDSNETSSSEEQDDIESSSSEKKNSSSSNKVSSSSNKVSSSSNKVSSSSNVKSSSSSKENVSSSSIAKSSSSMSAVELEKADFATLGECTTSNINEVKKTAAGKAYVCQGSSWRVATSLEAELNKACRIENLDIVFNGYKCVSEEADLVWQVASEAEIATEGVCGLYYPNTYKIVNGYVCVNLNDKGWTWREATAIEKKTKAVCTEKNVNTFDGSYVCVKNAKYNSELGSDYNWREKTAAETATGKVCTVYNVNTIVGSYACEKNAEYNSDVGSYYNWRQASAAELATGKLKCKAMEMINGYACDYTANGTVEWRAATNNEKELGMVCYKGWANKDTLVTTADTSKAYSCESSDWVLHKQGETGIIEDNRTAYANPNKSSYSYMVVAGMYWMTENLNFTNGHAHQDYESWCGGSDSYDEDDNPPCPNYGRLYSWYVVHRNICPTGWRVPTYLEMTRIKKEIESVPSVVKPQYAGYRKEAGSYLETGKTEYYWTETTKSGNDIYAGVLTKTGFKIEAFSADYGFSVRCVKNYYTIGSNE